MLANREYLLRVRATASGGVALQGPDESPYVIEQAVTYDPRLAFSINGASADWDNKRLLFDVQVRGAGGIKPIFDGQVTDDRGEVLIPVSHAALSDAGRLELALPERLLQARGEQKLHIRLTLASDAAPIDNGLDFSIVPPVRPFPWWALILAFLVAAMALLLLLRQRWPRPSVSASVAPAPKVLHSRPSGEIYAAPGKPRMRIRVVSSPDQTEVRANVVDKFPCVIGASNGADFIVRGASTVSRNHLQITHSSPNGFEITDLSRHGTFRVEGTRLEQLKPETAISLRGPVQLSLAKEIIIDLEPMI
jgi:hypothetical protein